MAFVVPDGQEHFFDYILDQVKSLISNKAWPEMETITLDTWIQNFKTDEEKYFAAHLLDSLVYRSNKMIQSSFFEIFNQIIPRELNANNLNQLLDGYKNSLLNSRESRVKFVTVKKRTAGASGSTFIRMFRRHLRIQQENTIELETAVEQADDIDVLVFVDDISGTGRQFTKCINSCFGGSQSTLRELYRDKLIIFTPLIAHEKAIEKITRDLPEVRVLPVELITHKHDFFYSDSEFFKGDGTNLVDDAKEFYREMLVSRGLEISNVFGYKSQALTCFFSDLSSPNNSLPIFYYDENQDWNPLFKR